MKTKQLSAGRSPRLALIALFLAFVAFCALAQIVRADPPAFRTFQIVTVGKCYTISNGAAAVQGQIVSDLGGGWYRVKVKDGRELSVNVAGAFFIEEIKTK